MAEPFDTATYLEDVIAIAQQKYFPEFTEEAPPRFGKITSQLFKPASDEITGDGKTMQVELAPADTVRSSIDPLGVMASPDSFEAGSLKVRFNKTNTSAHDFTRFTASAQVDDIDVKLAGKGSIVDFVDRIYNQVMPNYDEHRSILYNLARTALVGTLNGSTIARNDNITFASATATASNTNGLRGIMSGGGQIAMIRRGTRIDFVNPTTGAVNAGNVRVTDTNPGDPSGPSFGVEFVSTGITARMSTGNLASVGVSDQIYFSGEKDSGVYGLGAYFARPAATGDSFLGGVDRMSSTYRWLIPTATREGSTSAVVTASHFDDQAIAMSFRIEPGQDGMIFHTSPQIAQKLRNEIFQAVVIQTPPEEAKKRFANFGSIGLTYQHPHFGIVKIMSDPLCPQNTLRVIDPETWKSLYYGYKGLQPVRENGGHWYRLNETVPNTGKSLIWKADWYALECGWCTKPWRNGIILNITAS